MKFQLGLLCTPLTWRYIHLGVQLMIFLLLLFFVIYYFALKFFSNVVELI